LGPHHPFRDPFHRPMTPFDNVVQVLDPTDGAWTFALGIA
jgi:hypothetical protein